MPPRAATATNWASEVEALRKRIGELRSQRQALTHTIVPKAEALARVDHYVNELARSGAVPVEGFLAQRGSPPALLRDAVTDGTNGPARVGLSPVALLVAWLDPDRIKKRLKAEVEIAYQDGREAMQASDREALARTLADKQLELEISEETLIREADAAGIYIGRRPDADARALVSP